MADFSPACHTPQVSGLVDIKVALPFISPLQQLGHSTEQTDWSDRAYYIDVPGDKNGGSQGPPIDIQYIGEVHFIRFRLSSYNKTVVDAIRKRAVKAVDGTIPQDVVGRLLMSGGHGIRLLLHTDDPTDTVNFWTCLAREPINIGKGTKYSEVEFAFEAHRSPCGATGSGELWPGTSYSNVVWDRNSDDYS